MAVNQVNRKIILRFIILIITGILIEIGAVYLLDGIMNMLPGMEEINDSYSEVIDTLTVLEPKMIMQVIVVSPVLEEAVFRFSFIGLGLKLIGNLKKGSREIVNFWILNVISSIFFALYHGNIIQGSYAFLLGLLLGYIYYYLGKYLASLTVHMIINTSGLYLVPYLPSEMSDPLKIVIGTIVMLICLVTVKLLKEYIHKCDPEC